MYASHTQTYDHSRLEALLADYLAQNKSASSRTAVRWPQPLTPQAAPPRNSTQAAPSADEAAALKMLYGELARRLMPAVDAVLQRYESSGGAIYDELMDRETLRQIVDQILDEAQHYAEEVEEITLAADEDSWGRYQLLQALAETLALHEIHQKRQDNDWRNLNMLDEI